MSSVWHLDVSRHISLSFSEETVSEVLNTSPEIDQFLTFVMEAKARYKLQKKNEQLNNYQIQTS